MKFFEFLQIIYKNKNNEIKNQEEFVVTMFKSGGANFDYSEGYGKNLLSGKKPLTDDIRRLITNDFDWENLIAFIFHAIDESRLQNFFDAFKVPNDIEKDKEIMAISLCFQFKLFMEKGNEVDDMISEFYENVLDGARYDNQDFSIVNKNALLDAKLFIYKAIEALNKINPDDNVLNNQGPFDDFFSNIKSAHYAFIKNATYEVRQIYRDFCKGFFKKENPEDNFFSEVSNQAYKNLNLEKQIKYFIYDNDTLNDSITEYTTDLFEDFNINKTIEILKKVEAKNKKEIYFSEYIIFKVKNSNRNLLNDYKYILSKTIYLFNYLQKDIGTNDNIKKINKKIEEHSKKVYMKSISLVNDGTFYPITSEIEYASLQEMALFVNNNIPFKTGDTLIPISNNPLFKNQSGIKSFFESSLNFRVCLIKTDNKIDDMMTEIFTFNKDNTFRLFYIIPTCKAKVYRKIREISQIIKDDHPIGFMAFSVMSFIDTQDKNVLNMLTKERAKYAKNCLAGFYFENDKLHSLLISEEQIINSNDTISPLKVDKIITNLFVPIIMQIKKT